MHNAIRPNKKEINYQRITKQIISQHKQSVHMEYEFRSLILCKIQKKNTFKINCLVEKCIRRSIDFHRKSAKTEVKPYFDS